MQTGLSNDREDVYPRQVASFIMRKWSSYEILDPLTWHSVVPLETTYTVMLNGKPWEPDVAHVAVRRTGGKDLDKMPEEKVVQHLALFDDLVSYYCQMVKPYAAV